MKLLEFDKYYPDEASCREAFRAMRQQEKAHCSKCGSLQHTWLPSKEQFRCKQCSHYTTLRAGTVMQNSKFPFRFWFVAMHLLTSTRHTFSAVEIQHQLGHKRYQPIWEMVHKIRSVMGKRDAKYMIRGEVEMDEGFFTTEIPVDEKDEKLKAGVGSQAKTRVLVMAESTKTVPTKKNRKERKVGHIKMLVIPNLKATTIDGQAVKSIDKNAVITSDASTSHSHLSKEFAKVEAKVVKPEDIAKMLPWVHIANSKSLFTDIYHGVKREFLQEYLNEFCYKFNRRYFGENLFDKLVMVGATYRTDFEHRLYKKAG